MSAVGTAPHSGLGQPSRSFGLIQFRQRKQRSRFGGAHYWACSRWPKPMRYTNDLGGRYRTGFVSSGFAPMMRRRGGVPYSWGNAHSAGPGMVKGVGESKANLAGDDAGPSPRAGRSRYMLGSTGLWVEAHSGVDDTGRRVEAIWLNKAIRRTSEGLASPPPSHHGRELE